MDLILKRILLTSILLLASPAWAGWPVAVVDSFTVHASQIFTPLNVLANDTGDDLRITSVNKWSLRGGNVEIRYPTGHLTYTPPQNFAGEDNIWYVITDSQGRRNSAKVTVTVKSSTSRFPDPQPDFVKVRKDTSIRIETLKNDLGRNIRYASLNEWSQKGGRVEKVDYDQIKYTPPAGFVGADAFWYRIKEFDAAPEYFTKVTIEVTEQNSAGPYPQGKTNTVALDVKCLRRPIRPYCEAQALNPLQNDIGKNLKLAVDSRWSWKGGSVEVRYSKEEGYYLVYSPNPKTGDGQLQDKIWYTIEDEVGRTSWGVVVLNVTTSTI